MQKDEVNLQGDAGEHSTKTRWILVVAFGGMLLLMVLAGVDSLRSLRKLNQISNEVAQQFARRSHGLVTVVISFHTYTDEMEQLLLSDEPGPDALGVAEVTKRGVALHAAINDYSQDCVKEELLLLQQMEKSVGAEESSFNGLLAGSMNERKQLGRTVIHEKLMNSRMQVLQLASTLSALNEKRLGEQNEALVFQFLGLQAKLARMVFLTLIAGLLLSLVAIYYILRLEQRGRERYVALTKSRKELESLSRRLVDAQEAERRSISRELHDEVGQTLGALLMDIGHLSNVMSPDDKSVEQQITRIKTAAESAVKSIRDIALLLRPPMLDDLGLVAALEWQSRETSRRSEMEVDVYAEGFGDDPPNAVKVCIYRVVQEALRNAATHARARNANVMLKREESRIVVEISDDGKGFQPERMRGMGILGMEERVRQLKGTFLIKSMPGKGTTVRAELPLDMGGSAER